MTQTLSINFIFVDYVTELVTVTINLRVYRLHDFHKEQYFSITKQEGKDLAINNLHNYFDIA